MSQKVTTGVRPTLRIADKNQIPATEPERQYYFMDIAKEYLRQLSEEKGSQMTFHVSTFGCQMNARDSEKLVGILEKIGYVEEDSEEADFVIYNTCTVRENANNKVYGRLGYLNGFQKKNPFMMIGLCGCMMQEPTVVEKIKQSYRFVNLIFGTHNIYKFAELIVTALENSYSEHAAGHGTSMTIDIWKDTDKIVEDLEHGRLAGTVVSDQGNALTTLDLERDIGKKCLLRKALGKFFYRENIVSTDNSRFQRKPHLALNLGRFLDPLDLTEHFFTAFCAADGFLTVEGF